ncbi:hypothetical protein EVAR_89508_1 [Eumeta japonica]|uniref:Secreted protein n=1 Tax=Eumeta variegata TaxID=151549 RepID=A0A4C1Y8I4_EUMVA|nr:hypothetical protein EVAR_89508_1 [Eumeta japonica]
MRLSPSRRFWVSAAVTFALLHRSIIFKGAHAKRSVEAVECYVGPLHRGAALVAKQSRMCKSDLTIQKARRTALRSASSRSKSNTERDPLLGSSAAVNSEAQMRSVSHALLAETA